MHDCHQGTDRNAAEKERRKVVMRQTHGVFRCGSKNRDQLLFSRLDLSERSWTREN